MNYSDYTNIASAYALDADGEAFVAASGITDDTQISAIANLVGGLKAQSLYDKMIAVYPLVGGSAAAHKWNLIDPQDADGSFRLTFGGTLTHNANGITGSANGYVNSHIVPDTDLVIGNYHITAYNSLDINAAGVLFGAVSTTKTIQLAPDHTYLTNTVIADRNDSERIINYNTNAKGYWCIVDKDTPTTTHKQRQFYLYCDGSNLSRRNGDTAGLPTVPLHFLAKGTTTTPNNFYAGCLSFATVGEALTQDEQNDLNAIVHTFQTALGRANADQGRTYTYTKSADLFSIVDDGTKTPALVTNARLQEYEALGVGALICFNLESFANNNTAEFGTTPSSPNEMICPSITVQDWIDGMVGAGINYAALTVDAEKGFSIIDLPFIKNNTLIAPYDAPRKWDIGIAPAFYQTLWDEFVTKSRTAGIEPIPYINLASDYMTAYQFINTYIPDAAVTAWVNYKCKLIQWLIQEYSLRYIWVDAYQAATGMMQAVYNAVKAVSADCLVIANTVGDINFTKYPYDIGSNEEPYGFVDKTDEDVFNPVRSNSGITHYIPQEGCMNMIGVSPTGLGGWYYKSTMALRPQAEYQAFYDRCVAEGANFMISLVPDRSGVISAAQFAVFADLEL